MLVYLLVVQGNYIRVLDIPSGRVITRSQQNVDVSRSGTCIVDKIYRHFISATGFRTPQPHRKVVSCSNDSKSMDICWCTFYKQSYVFVCIGLSPAYAEQIEIEPIPHTITSGVCLTLGLYY